MKGVAHVLPAEYEAQVKTALKRKYGWMMRVGSFVDKIGGKKRDCYLEITPAK